MIIVGECQRVKTRQRTGSNVERCRECTRELRFGRTQRVVGITQIHDREFHSDVLVEHHRCFPPVIRRVAGAQDVVAGRQRSAGVPDLLLVNRPLNPEAKTHHVCGGPRVHAILDPQPGLGGTQWDDGVSRTRTGAGDARSGSVQPLGKHLFPALLLRGHGTLSHRVGARFGGHDVGSSSRSASSMVSRITAWSRSTGASKTSRSGRSTSRRSLTRAATLTASSEFPPDSKK